MTRDYRRRPAVGCLGPVSFREGRHRAISLYPNGYREETTS